MNTETLHNAHSFSFSHIYIERDARNYADTETILQRFPQAKQIFLRHYKDVFNRRQQSFSAQKRSVKLILAVQKKRFMYRGSERIRSFKEDTVWYNALIRNCIYNCEYCFLQGIHKTANIVIFVNNDDFMEAAYRASRTDKPLYLSISYLSDLLAFEKLIPFNRRWIEFARKTSNIQIESRTKSSNYNSIQDLKPCNNFILVWSMTPEGIAKRFEPGCASLANRIFQVRKAIQDGWRIRLAFDPIIPTSHWQKEYRDCIEAVFKRIPADSVEALSLGVFRMYPEFLKYMRKDRPESQLLNMEFSEAKNEASHNSNLIQKIQTEITALLTHHIPVEKIY